ncbi:MAG TPA: glycosyltransferase family 39 protein [Conexibacter sp.]|jgi:mannosyltransferase|nr:glycosyltransferase family 39 protein [Conexibacter sp.]
MATVAVPRSERLSQLRASDALLAGATLVVLVAISGYVRTRAIGGSFWMDEGLSVGISSHALMDIPSVLRQDGSPPLYYMLLHVWMDVFGRSETAVHWLSLTAALLTIPAAMWAGWSLWGRRAGYVGAVVCSLVPFLTAYGEEARMYALMALFALLTTAFFLHAFVYRRRRYLPAFAIGQALMLYTHSWGIFYGVGAAAVLVYLWHVSSGDERSRLLKDGLLAFGAAAILYLPWVPTLLYQAQHTAAPWANKPRFGVPIQIARDVLGGYGPAVSVLLVGGFGVAVLLGAHKARGERERLSVWVLLAIPVVTLGLAWGLSQISPAWASRYFAAIVGPLLLLIALGFSRAGKLGLVALAVLCVFWIKPTQYVDGYKSDVRDIGAEVGSQMRAGDLVLVGQPEQTPLVWYYMPGGVRYADTIGLTADPRHMDWVDALDRLEAAQPDRVLPGLLAKLRPGQQVLFVRPLTEGVENWRAPWTQLVRRRSAQWGAILAGDTTLRQLQDAPRFYRGASTVGNSAVLYEKTASPQVP